MRNGTDHWPHEWCAPFLEAFAETGNVTHSARLVEISRQRAYQVRKEIEAFAEAWDEAEEAAVSLVLTPEAIRRAVEGTEKPVWYQGKQVGVEREYSDKLLEFLLRSHAPARYNQPIKQEHTGTGPIIVDLTPASEDEL